jgi:hypothetical protein
VLQLTREHANLSAAGGDQLLLGGVTTLHGVQLEASRELQHMLRRLHLLSAPH